METQEVLTGGCSSGEEEGTWQKEPSRRASSAWRIAVLVSLVAVGCAVFFLSQRRPRRQLVQGATQLFNGSTSGGTVWTPTPPEPASWCRIRAYKEAHFEGLAVDLGNNLTSPGALQDLPDILGSLQVEGNCTAVLRDRAHLDFWPCFFPPGWYAEIAALTEHCPNLATSRALGVHGGVLTEGDRIGILYKYIQFNDSGVCSANVSNGTWKDADQQEAKAWFESNVNIYVINMDISVDRWAQMVEDFAKQNITNYFRSTGPDARDPAVIANAKVTGDIVNQDFEVTLPGNVGCTLGHFGAWHAAMKSDKQYAIVLEDDARLANNFVREVWELVFKKVPSDWDFVSLFNLGRPFGHCVAPHLLRAVKSSELTPCTWLWYGWGAQGFLYRRAQLPAIWELFRHRFFGGTRVDFKCVNLDMLLYGATDVFNVYTVDNIHPLVYTNMSEKLSVRKHFGGSRL